MNSRRIVYLIMMVAVAIPLLFKTSQKPSRMVAAERMYDVMENVPVAPGEVAMVFFDFGPNTIAENGPQAETILEHLFRRRIPTILISQYQQAEGFLSTVPRGVAARLEKEMPGQKWSYGEAWINVGYKPMPSIFLQALVNSEDVSKFLGRDANGMPISQYPAFSKIKGVESIKLVGQVTGLVGTFDTIIQFFQKSDYRPTLVHGCTSITIPEAYIFLDSKQLSGLLEGMAGAVWYSEILKKHHPESDNSALLVRNTALAVAHIVLILLIVIGNIVPLVQSYRRNHGV